MQNLFALLAFLAVIAFIVSVTLVCMKSKRAMGLKILSGSVAAFIVAVIGASVSSPNQEELEKAAHSAGFSSAEDYSQALSNGMHSADEWKNKKTELAAKRAQAEAAKKAERDFYTQPSDEAAFIQAVESARQDYDNAPNELAKGGMRRQRAKAICAAVKSAHVNGWTGVITRLSTNSDGFGIFSVKIDDGIEMKTWNNALSDSFDNTLIDPDSPLFKKLAGLSRGQKIRFSGRLFPNSNADCYKETSLTLDGAMTDPEFLFRFSSVDTYSAQ